MESITTNRKSYLWVYFIEMFIAVHCYLLSRGCTSCTFRKWVLCMERVGYHPLHLVIFHNKSKMTHSKYGEFSIKYYFSFQLDIVMWHLRNVTLCNIMSGFRDLRLWEHLDFRTSFSGSAITDVRVVCSICRLEMQMMHNIRVSMYSQQYFSGLLWVKCDDVFDG